MRHDSFDVSVVIPTRGDRPELLARAIGGVLEQSLSPKEIIVVVDGRDASNIRLDGSQSEISQRVIANSHAPGPGGARNCGALAAKGSWVAFLDDDDEWERSKLQIVENELRRSDYSATVVASKAFHIDHEGVSSILPVDMPYPGQDYRDYILRKLNIFSIKGFTMPSIVVRRETFETILFREDLERFEDGDWLVRLVRSDEGRTLLPLMEPLVKVRAAPRLRSADRQSTASSPEVLVRWAYETLGNSERRLLSNFLVVVAARDYLRHDSRWRALKLLMQYAWPRSNFVSWISGLVLFIRPWNRVDGWLFVVGKKYLARWRGRRAR